MKYSNVFKTFSNSILLPIKSDRNVLTFTSEESAGTEKGENSNKELKYLEEQLHVPRNSMKTSQLQTIKVPNYGTQTKSEKNFANILFVDSVSSPEAENVENQQNTKNKLKTKDNSHRNNDNSAIYLVPDTTHKRYTNNDKGFSDDQWEANLENEKRRHYYSNTKKILKYEKVNKLNNTVMIPVNSTMSAEKQVLHFYDNPMNRIEEISRDDDGSVLVLR